jgi:hypothetical protein
MRRRECQAGTYTLMYDVFPDPTLRIHTHAHTHTHAFFVFVFVCTRCCGHNYFKMREKSVKLERARAHTHTHTHTWVFCLCTFCAYMRQRMCQAGTQSFCVYMFYACFYDFTHARYEHANFLMRLVHTHTHTHTYIICIHKGITYIHTCTNFLMRLVHIHIHK